MSEQDGKSRWQEPAETEEEYEDRERYNVSDSLCKACGATLLERAEWVREDCLFIRRECPMCDYSEAFYDC